MAAAEARACWQRANRCLVQEDAKRAPKLACCTSSSTSQTDSGNGNTASTKDNPTSCFTTLSRIPMNLDLSPNTKWWLQLQPNYYQKDFMYEQLSSLEDNLDEEVENLVAASNPSWEPFSDNSTDFDIEMDGGSESPGVVSTASIKHGFETRIKMEKITNYSQRPQKNMVNYGNYLCKNDDLLDWEPAGCVISKKSEKASPEPGTRWAGGKKSEPWWRIADQDELALLVAQKSLQHIENCDLPRPTQKVQFTTDSYSCPEYLGGVGMLPSSLDQKLCAGMPNVDQFSQNSFISGRLELDDKNSSSAGGYMLHSSEKQHSCTQDSVPVRNDSVESNQTSENEHKRAELLEALRRSQTRARKAEMAAQKANDEKDHILKLLFWQASPVFAYKQWLQILQLENLCLQLNVKDCQIPSFIPVLPRMPLKGKPSWKAKTSPKRRLGLYNNFCFFCKYAVVVTFGIGMAGTGLLLGWTFSWLPTF